MLSDGLVHFDLQRVFLEGKSFASMFPTANCNIVGGYKVVGKITEGKSPTTDIAVASWCLDGQDVQCSNMLRHPDWVFDISVSMRWS